MNGKDKNVKKLFYSDIRRTCEMRAEDTEKQKPSKKAEEHFRRKAYTKHD